MARKNDKKNCKNMACELTDKELEQASGGVITVTYTTKDGEKYQITIDGAAEQAIIKGVSPFLNPEVTDTTGSEETRG